VYRPLQCIGTSLLFDTKLIIALQLVVGSTISDSLLPKGRFNIELFLATTLVTAVTSLLLACIWTLDDTGIRYFNRKEHELKMAGKFIGTIMPIVFGFSGVRGLLATFPTSQAVGYLFNIFVILYPPFTVFSVLHYHFVKRKYDSFLGIGGLKKGSIKETYDGDIDN
jgi:predicted DNA repair protein MutK